MTQNNNSIVNAEADKILREEGYEAFVAGLYNRTGDLSKDFAHAVLGLRTECHELLQARDLVNGIEEAGDLYFYGEALTQVVKDFTGEPMTLINPDEMAAHPAVAFGLAHSAQETMEYALNQLEDMAKRWVGYGKAPAVTTLDVMLLSGAAARSALQMSVVRAHLDQGERFDHVVMVTNITKLMDRYKGRKFDADRAVNRDIDAERRTLENAVAS